jgi:hypothetical protein
MSPPLLGLPDSLLDCCATYNPRTARKTIFEAWRSECAYCGQPGAHTLDHVQPKSKGGLNEAKNLIPACCRCNGHKGSKDVKDWYESQSFFSLVRWQKIQEWRERPWI